MTLQNAAEGREYRVKSVRTGDGETDAFLYSLGCCPGETVTVIARRKGGCTVAIKDGRYNLDPHLAATIEV